MQTLDLLGAPSGRCWVVIVMANALAGALTIAHFNRTHGSSTNAWHVSNRHASASARKADDDFRERRVQRKESRGLRCMALANGSKVLEIARRLLKGSFVAGGEYPNVWVRDLNTFLETALEVNNASDVRDQLLGFFERQHSDGEVPDGYIPAAHFARIIANWQKRIWRGQSSTRDFHGRDETGSFSIPSFINTGTFWGRRFGPCLAAGRNPEPCKNDASTDQESSLVQAVARYVHATGDYAFLSLRLDDGSTVLERLEMALRWVLRYRRDWRTGLIWGGTTVDWGDTQVERDLFRDDIRSLTMPRPSAGLGGSHRACNTYAAAMLMMAIDAQRKLIRHVMPLRGHTRVARLSLPHSDWTPVGEEPIWAMRARRWDAVHAELRRAVRRYLWPKGRPHPLPHYYLDGSPFPASFNESAIRPHGSMAVAAQAGLLSKAEVLAAYRTMRDSVRRAAATGRNGSRTHYTIGLTVFPAYPEKLRGAAGVNVRS